MDRDLLVPCLCQNEEVKSPDSIILHSATDYVPELCSALNQQQSRHLYLPLQLTDPRKSSEVATKLQADNRKNYIIFLDKQLLEILENKKSRKLFTTIAGKVQSDQFNVIVVRYRASVCSDDEVKEFLHDLDYNDTSVIDLENRDAVRTITSEIDRLSVPREATESEDPVTQYIRGNNSSVIPSGYGSDLNYSHSSNNWNPLNPESILKSPECSPNFGPGANHISGTVRLQQAVESYNSFDSTLSSVTSEESERTDSECRRRSLNDLNKDKTAPPFPKQPQKPGTSDANTSTSKQSPRGLYVDIPDKVDTETRSNTTTANIDRNATTDPGNNSTGRHSNPELGINSGGALDDLCGAMKNMNPSNSDPGLCPSNLTSYVRQGHQSTMQEVFNGDICMYCGQPRANINVRMGSVPGPYRSPNSFFQISSGPEAMPYYCGFCCDGNSLMYGGEIPRHHQPVHGQNPQANKPFDGSFNMSNLPQALQNSMRRSWEEGKRMNNSFHASPPQQAHGQHHYNQRSTNTNFPNYHPMQGNQAQAWNQTSTLYERANSEPTQNAQRLTGNQPQQAFSTYPNFHDNRGMVAQQPLNDVNNGLQLRPEILLMQRQQQQPPFNRNISLSSSDTNNTRLQMRGLGSGQSFPSNQIPSTYLSNQQNSSARPLFFIPGPQSDEVGPSGGRAYPVPSINEAAGGASAADADGDIPLMDLSKHAMDYIQNSMDFASSQFNWETLADLHGWSFGMIHQLKQKWTKRQIESPFIELLGTGQFQNYTLRQLREDLNKIPRKDVLEKLKEFEDNGILVIK